jgi:hypothetical protein
MKERPGLTFPRAQAELQRESNQAGNIKYPQTGH